MSNPKEAAQTLSAKALDAKVKFPKIWDSSKIMQTCGATIMLHRVDGSFNIDAALEELIEKYGQEEQEEEKAAPQKGKKRKSAKEGDEDGEDISPKKKGPKKIEIMAEERNRPVAEAIMEMASIYFKNKDARKGGVFGKAAKALRECPTYISCTKEAMALKGVGKGIAGYIQEYLDNGSIVKLEELRGGVA